MAHRAVMVPACLYHSCVSRLHVPSPELRQDLFLCFMSKILEEYEAWRYVTVGPGRGGEGDIFHHLPDEGREDKGVIVT